MESRVYAEDPLRGFLPSIGRLERYIEPRSGKSDPGNHWSPIGCPKVSVHGCLHL